MKKALKYVDAYMKFMYNDWDFDTCISIFGETLGGNIWDKWIDIRAYDGVDAAITGMWWKLDHECLEKILDRAFKTYNIDL